jgi:hypothetical protein
LLITEIEFSFECPENKRTLMEISGRRRNDNNQIVIMQILQIINPCLAHFFSFKLLFHCMGLSPADGC